jgi:hypothetical protein
LFFCSFWSGYGSKRPRGKGKEKERERESERFLKKKVVCECARRNPKTKQNKKLKLN